MPFWGKINAKASNMIIAGTIIFSDRMTYVLIDLGSTYSYVSI